MTLRKATGYILRAALIIVLLFYPHFAFPQVLSDSLSPVSVQGQHKEKINDARINDFTPGQQKIIIDSVTIQQYQSQFLSNLIAQQTPVFVKSYGFNSLATLNFRGSSSAQSQLYWNGVPLQNAALGIADLSQLPIALIDNVSIIYGSSSALLGSGNVGGALLLENDAPVFDTVRKSIALSVAAGSYNQYIGSIKAKLVFHKWFFSLAAFLQSAQNGFPYTLSDGTKKHQTNSQLQSQSVMLQAGYKLNKADVLDIYFWSQLYDRHIPPALFESSSIKRQTDFSTRFLVDLKHHYLNDDWFVKASIIHDETHYLDSAIFVNALTPVFQFFFDAGWKHAIRGYDHFLLDFPVQFSWTDYHNKTQLQTKVAVVAAYDAKFFHNRLDMSLSARQETIDDNGIFSPGLNASYACSNSFALLANVQHTYRAPTLNELYFFPGGNADLKPEQGWAEDIGYKWIWNSKNYKAEFKHDLSIFSRDITDWIVWFGGAFWTPHNIQQVWSRGAETENSFRYHLNNNWYFHVGLNTSIVMATTQLSYFPNDGSLGKQIPYTPLYNGQVNIGFNFKHLYFNYNHCFTGIRYVTVDESESVAPYNIGSVQLSYDLNLHQNMLTLSAQCNNLWSQQYQVVAYRPMPGANFLFGLRLSLQ
jgi:iron complex outermembrane receptor protein